MDNEQTFVESARTYGESAGQTWAHFVRTIVDGIVAGKAVYDPTASNGVGAWKSGSWATLLRELLAAAGKTKDDKLPYVNTPSASVTGECIRVFFPQILAESDVDKRHKMCDAFAAEHSKNKCNDMVNPKDAEPTQDEQDEQDEQPETLAAIAARFLAQVAAAGYSNADAIAEVIAQAG